MRKPFSCQDESLVTELENSILTAHPGLWTGDRSGLPGPAVVGTGRPTRCATTLTNRSVYWLP